MSHENLERSKTFFKCIKHNFPNVDETKIETKVFLEASEEVVDLVVRLGKLYTPVRDDMNKNIQRIYSVYEKDTTKNKYLHDLILFENDHNATIGLLWLRRTLHFLLRFFEAIIDAYKRNNLPENLEKLLQMSYKETLMPYHNPFLTKPLFNVLFKLTMGRPQFFEILANSKNIDPQLIICDMEEFNKNLRKCINDLTSFYENNQLGNTERI